MWRLLLTATATGEKKIIEKVGDKAYDMTVGKVEEYLDSILLGIKEWFIGKMVDLWDSFTVVGIQLLFIACVCFIVYNGYKIFIIKENDECFRNIFMTVAVFTTARIFWKVVFRI